MGYSGLLMEFGEHPMHSWELFSSAKESKRQALADSIHFVFFWHIKEPELEEIQNDKYKDLLIEEAGDVLCMIELMVEHGLLTNEELGARVTVKRGKLATWSNLIK
jgi:hypothetical protein